MMNYVAKHDLTLSGLDLSNTKLLTVDLSHVNAGLKKKGVKPWVGILGADVLWSRHEKARSVGAKPHIQLLTKRVGLSLGLS